MKQLFRLSHVLIFTLLCFGFTQVFAQKKPTTKPNNTKPTNTTKPNTNTKPNTTAKADTAIYGSVTPKELEEYREQAKRMVSFVQYSFNSLGDEDLTPREKETIIQESYLKFFDNSKVQIEDDLDESRQTVTNKDVQAYLKDIDFFFKYVKFEYNVEKVENFMNSENRIYFKVTVNRNLTGETLDGKKINSNKPRFIEMNLYESKRELKIVSIYTTKLNENEEIKAWWSGLDNVWKQYLTADLKIADSISLEQIKQVMAREEIDLANNGTITSLEPLLKITGLKKLNISRTKINSLAPLRNQNKLQYLNCEQTEVSDFSPLKYSSSLQEVNVSKTKIKDLEALRNFVALERLDISNTQVTDIEPLAELSELKELRVTGTALSSLGKILDLKKLEVLDMGATKITDLKGIDALTNLQKLIIENNIISDLQAVGNLQKLEYLWANNTQIGNLQPIEKVSTLRQVLCDNTKVKKADADKLMAKLPNCLVIYNSEALTMWWKQVDSEWKMVLMKAINGTGTPTKEQLSQISILTELNLSNNKLITTLQPLVMMSKLRKLDVSACGINDLSPLKGAEELETLNISGTSVITLEPISGLNNLQTLNASKTQVVDIKPLEKMTALKTAYFEGTKLSREKVQDFVLKFPEHLIVFQTEAYATWWRFLTPEWKALLNNYVKTDATPTPEQLHRIAYLESIKIPEGSSIDKLSPLTFLLKLKELTFIDTKLKTLDEIAPIKTLEKLVFSRNQINNLSPIANITNLKYLEFENTPVTELKELKNLVNLEVIKCAGTQIKSLEGLENKNKMEQVEFFNTKVGGFLSFGALKPLEEMKNLKIVKCYNTSLSKGTINSFKEKMEKSGKKIEVVYY